MRTYKTLIHLTNEHSIDHLAGFIWHLLSKKHEVNIYFLSNGNYINDNRITHFTKYKNFKILNKEEYYENKYNYSFIKILNFYIKYFCNNYINPNTFQYKIISRKRSYIYN